MISEYSPAYWADEIGEVRNNSGFPLFHKVELVWQKPTIWAKDQRRPTIATANPCVYALLHDHGNSRTRDRIVYVGLTISPRERFNRHEKAVSIVQRRGQVRFSYANVRISGRNQIERTKQALEDIEHLLIWSIPHKLYNEKKMYTLPGMGSRHRSAWHILNLGYRFFGGMPREIVYPWILLKKGRDRSTIY